MADVFYRAFVCQGESSMERGLNNSEVDLGKHFCPCLASVCLTSTGSWTQRCVFPLRFGGQPGKRERERERDREREREGERGRETERE
jgi:hypothetical protein